MLLKLLRSILTLGLVVTMIGENNAHWYEGVWSVDVVFMVVVDRCDGVGRRTNRELHWLICQAEKLRSLLILRCRITRPPLGERHGGVRGQSHRSGMPWLAVVMPLSLMEMLLLMMKAVALAVMRGSSGMTRAGRR